MWRPASLDRKSTRLNSSHLGISYAVFCLKKSDRHTLSAEPADSLPDRISRSCHASIINQSRLPLLLGAQLKLQKAHQVGIGHRRQRMIPHSAIAQQNTPYEQVAQVYGAFILGKCRHNSAEITAQFIH